jgi:putative hemolysin
MPLRRSGRDFPSDPSHTHLLAKVEDPRQGAIHKVCMDILILLLLIFINGLFAMSEMAIVSSRKARLQQRADEGSSGAVIAMRMQSEPGHFLSTIQVGITSIGILSGAFGEAALADRFQAFINHLPLLAPYSKGIATVLMVICITYLSVVLGELVPKRLALYNPEGIAALVAPPMRWISSITLPLVKLFSVSSEFLLKLIGAVRRDEPPVTQDEIRVLMEQGAEAGVFEKSEQRLVANIFQLDDKNLRSIMTPRVDVFYVDLNDPVDENKHKFAQTPFNTIPVVRGGLEHIVGVVRSKDLLARVLSGEEFDLAAMVQPALFVPQSVSPMQVLETFKKARSHTALIVDEYGDLQGIVSMNDVMEAIVGDIPSSTDQEEAQATRREDGSWLVDGMITNDRFKEILAIESKLPDEDTGNFHTIGGFVMMQLGRVPRVADHFEWEGYRFEVVDMDKNRIDKILVVPPSSV